MSGLKINPSSLVNQTATTPTVSNFSNFGLQSNLNSLGSSAFTTPALNTAGSTTGGAAGSIAGKAAGGLSKGQAWLGGIGAGLAAAQLGFNIYSQVTSHKQAEDQLQYMKDQLTIENDRWKDREAERKKNNEIASAYATPELPTQRD